jgi:transposase
VRRLDEAAAAGQRVVVELQVRRFRCCEPACPKATFVEQVPGLTFRHGRRSQGLHATLQRVALMLADRAGSRPADALATPVSRSTLLRLIHAVPESAPVTPRVLGVDEFALRKGHVYATVLVDIETHRVVDLLPDRTVETVSAWLAAHPGVEVICRHRPASFGEAGRIGAPDASSPRRPAACLAPNLTVLVLATP